MKKFTCAALTFLAMGAALPACSTEPKTASDKATLGTNVDAALASFKNADTSLQGELDKAAGYAVFPEVGKGGLIVGGSYGRGELTEHGKKVGYCDITQGTVGLQIGAQTFAQLIIFKDKAPLEKFKDGKFAFAANLSAVAIKPGAAGSSNYANGTVVFIQAKGGLMAEAAIGGQNFTFKAY